MKYMEFISALQKLIDSRRPRISEVRVCVNDQDYTITDSRGHAIEPELYQTAKREGVDKDDLLIGLLIVAAPLRLSLIHISQCVKNNKRPGVSDVYKVVDGGTADIHGNFSGNKRCKFFFFAGHSIENFHI